MEFWSKGLGTKKLVLSLGKSSFEVKEGRVILTGTVDAPADWNYRVQLEERDLKRILEMATSPQLATYLASCRGRAPLRQLLLGTLKVIARLGSYSIFKN